MNPTDLKNKKIKELVSLAACLDIEGYNNMTKQGPIFAILKEQADGQAENEDERFDIDFTLMTGEVARLLDDLLEALGGEIEKAL